MNSTATTVNASSEPQASCVSKFGAIASGHAATTQSAQEVLESGGNAYDAIIAATLVACAAEPVLASLGGGGFFLGKPRNQSVQCLDFFTQSPMGEANPSHQQDKITVNFSNASQDFYIGAASTATPGVVKGLFSIHQTFGKLPISELFSLAAQRINAGIIINHSQHKVLSLVEAIYLYDTATRKLYQSKLPVNKAQILQPGEVFKNSDLANTIEMLGREGERLFYQGDIADKICQMMLEKNGSLQRADLHNYQCEWRQPMHYSLSHNNKKHMDIYANSAPAIGGYYLKSILMDYQRQAISNPNFNDNGNSSIDINWHYRVLSQQLVTLFQPPINTQKFNLPDHDITALKAILASRKIAPKGTTHISVMDKEQNLASLTLSNGEGNGLIIPGTGIMLNNMLGEEDVNPFAPNAWICNQRLSSMMTPTITQDNENLYCLGTGGSNRIPSALAQTLIPLFFYNQSLEEAIDFPRMHFDKVFNLECVNDVNQEKFDLMQLRQHLSPHGHAINLFDSLDFYFGGVNAVHYHTTGRIRAYSDKRRTE